MPSGGGGSAPSLLRLERWGYKAARQLGSEAAKCNIDAKTQRSEEAKSVSEAAKKLRSEVAKCNILFSPLEGEKKFLGELCELRNFREGYKKYKTLDRATECAIVCVGDKKGKILMNKNNLQQKQLNNPVASPETNHSPLTIHHSPKRIAFTLAEVLITLGIIGIVAALTLPSIISKKENLQNQVALKKAYSTLSQALQMWQQDNGGFCNISDSTKRHNHLKKELLQYFSSAVDCGSGNGEKDCYYVYKKTDLYLIYSGKRSFNGLYLDDGQYIVSDGMIYFFQEQINSPVLILVDVNGLNKKPNKAGVDLFAFEVLENCKLTPVGSKDSSYTDLGKYCSKTSWQPENGIACTYQAIYSKDFWK